MIKLITLTTDFGTRDPYVAAMKGAILTRCPTAVIADLTHEISPCDILEGALFLAGAVPYFPKETIHIAVVDPSVGTARLPIVARIAGYLVVCPNNGILTYLAEQYKIDYVHAITNPEFMRPDISATFHGRDIFAPAAAALAAGASIDMAGAAVRQIEKLPVRRPVRENANVIQGQIIHVDRFGNLITNIHRSMLDMTLPLTVHCGSLAITKLSFTYAEVQEGEALALIGSFGYLEIAVNLGNARQKLRINPGDTVNLTA